MTPTEFQVLQEISSSLNYIEFGVWVIVGAAVIDFFFGKWYSIVV